MYRPCIDTSIFDRLQAIPLNGLARIRDGTRIGEANMHAARREPRPPGITKGHSGPSEDLVRRLKFLKAAHEADRPRRATVTCAQMPVD